MKKINKKGFVLVETLVVSVFVVGVFAFLYVNVLPLVGNYEEEEKYDSIDTKYIGNLIRNQINQMDSGNLQHIKESVEENDYYDLSDCIESNERETKFEAMCLELKEIINVEDIYITKYEINNLKNKGIDGDNKEQLNAYIDFLPTYEEIPSNARYRLIISIRDIFVNNELYYGTIEFDI